MAPGPRTNKGFQIGDKVVIPETAYVTNHIHVIAKRDKWVGEIVRHNGSFLVSILWSSGIRSSIADDLIVRVPFEQKEAPEMATNIATARVNVKLQFDHSGLADEIIAFRDRLQQAGFTAKQATRIAANAFATPTHATPEEV